MVSKAQILMEAVSRQGTHLEIHRAPYRVEGDDSSAKFRMGEEGLVHLAVKTRGPTEKRRVKVFFNPDEARRHRSRYLVRQELSDEKRTIDVLGGAPYAMLEGMGEFSRFALVMKNVEGESWKDLRQNGENAGVYPPPNWAPLQIRLLWAYGLTVAVQKMEERHFVHADLSDGNVVMESDGPHAGAMALVDFDGYHHEKFISKYRGTTGYAAPEIWNSGNIGVGSDRVAMAILIQDFLIAGDPALDKQEAFRQRYTPDEICALQCKAHPLFRQKYPSLAALLEITLQSGDRQSRPAPAAWREALLAIYGEPPGAGFQLMSLEGREGGEVVRLGSGGVKDLLSTRFGIGAAIAFKKGEGWRLRPHRGVALKVKPGEEPWQDVKAEFPLRGECLLFDPGGKATARFVPTAQAGKGPEAAAGLTPLSFHESLDDGGSLLKAIVTRAIIALCLLMLLWLAYSVAAKAAHKAWAHHVQSVEAEARAAKAARDAQAAHDKAVLDAQGAHDKASHDKAVLDAQAAHDKAAHDKAVLDAQAAHDKAVHDKAVLDAQAAHDKAVHDKAVLDAQAAREQAAREQAVHEQAVHDHDQTVHDQAVHDQAVHDHDQAVHDQAVRDQAVRDQAARVEAAPKAKLPPPPPPSHGSFTWQGQVNGSTLLVIENGMPSFGRVYGTPLPGMMCFLQISDHRHFSIAEAPAVSNKWQRVVLNVQGKGTMNVNLTWALPNSK